MFKDVELTNPNLGAELLRNPKGDLPIDVWGRYFWEHSDNLRPVLTWCIDPSDPDLVAIKPQRAVDEAGPLVAKLIGHLMSNSPAKALTLARQAFRLLGSGSSHRQTKRGQAASTHHIAVRAYIIRKFNPHPNKPRESSVSWHKLADMLFVKNGKCSRCDLARHQYDSPCVKALMVAVRRLHTAMKHDGIPV
jgi:hypothetical protein